MSQGLTVLVLGGGPDAEREVSLRGAEAVARALEEAGHDVVRSDIGPKMETVLDTPADVVFPVLHGRFGEGGPLQRMLEARNLKFVGSGSKAAAVAMDKLASKQIAERYGIPTPTYQQFGTSNPLVLQPPLVIKPLAEGSSIGVHICRTPEQVGRAVDETLVDHAYAMAEQFVGGKELTVGIVDKTALSPLWIVPNAEAVEYYDMAAKYDRDDTQYLFRTGLPDEVLEDLKDFSMKVYEGIGCRHLSRVDFIVDESNQPWFLEINTMPGFTGHSLLPMAAREGGLEMPALCDRLVRLALRD